MAKNFIAYLFLSIILVILTVVGYDNISIYFQANPYINGIILATLAIGFLLYSFKIFSLSSEYRFMNSVTQVLTHESPSRGQNKIIRTQARLNSLYHGDLSKRVNCLRETLLTYA